MGYITYYVISSADYRYNGISREDIGYFYGNFQEAYDKYTELQALGSGHTSNRIFEYTLKQLMIYPDHEVISVKWDAKRNDWEKV